MSNILKRRGKEKRKKLEAGLAGDMLPPGTMLVSFKKYMLDEPDSIDRVLDYLNIRSAILSGLVDKDHEFDADERQEMYDFYDYFLENYDDKTKLARMERWNGEEPFIIQAIQNLYDQDNEVYSSDLDERMSAKAKIETAALVDRILNIQKEKVISIVIGNDVFSVGLDAVIKPEDLKKTKENLYYSCAEMILESGLAIVCTKAEDCTEVFAVVGVNGNEWLPVSKEDLSDLLDEDEDENLEYVEIKK